ncbi:hypothetical protein Mal48_06290 [Thalassoglobus polymorphus]|uniref:Uncharacterized protein n=1 Tax=Thalassoglobus polymorphus TaxID=2527994 RepID=A0A517QID2_9PLAN|nr:hypothetical protein Mal48_06290 [Thalassoglobus polymorphus]
MWFERDTLISIFRYDYGECGFFSGVRYSHEELTIKIYHQASVLKFAEGFFGVELYSYFSPCVWSVSIVVVFLSNDSFDVGSRVETRKE